LFHLLAKILPTVIQIPEGKEDLKKTKLKNKTAQSKQLLQVA